MKNFLLLVFSLLLAVVTYASKTITGVVTSAEDGLPVIGASVMLKGTTVGTITDIDGKYSIAAPENSTLVVSYIGLDTQNVKLGNQSSLNIVLKASSVQMDEVVVTAMGVKAEKKRLNFAVQTLEADEVTAGQSANFVNSLQGKISGVTVSGGGGSPNASSQIVIRAISSINPSQSNEPLFIIDGMAVRGGGAAAGDLNPNDIENLTVLKGAAASALYGQEAANGVVMITTKNGKAGKITVNASANFQVDEAFRNPRLQTMYGPGAQGFYKTNTMGGWGPLLQPGETVYDNVGKFLGTGFYQKYDVSASGGTDKFTAYASANYTMSSGIVPNDYNNRLGVLVKADYKISKQVKIALQSNFVNTKSRGLDANNPPLQDAYRWPINDDMSNYKNSDGTMSWLYDISSLSGAEKLDATINPYWIRYEDFGESESTRNILIGSIEYTPVKDLIFTGKVSYDLKSSSSDSYITSRFNRAEFDDPIAYPDAPEKGQGVLNNSLTKLGAYAYSPSRNEMLTAQVMGTYKAELGKGFSMNFLFGAEYKQLTGVEAVLAGQEFVLPGGFNSYQNTAYSVKGTGEWDTRMYHFKQNKFGYFGEIRADYKGIAHISATGRCDMSSTLSTKPYFYPSVTAGLIFSEMFEIAGDVFSYGKIRGNWAQVGKDGPRYLFDRQYREMSSFPDKGFAIDPTRSYANSLEPEMTSTWEIGLDIRLFKSKTRLDIAYYSTLVDNQIVTVRVSPAAGSILQTRNEGAVKNEGVEIQLSQDLIHTSDIKWTANLNFSLNRGTVTKLPEGMVELQGRQFGDIFATAYLNGSTTAISGKDYLRTPEGQIICSADGYPMINPAKSVLIGNREPDFLLGLSSSFSWRDLSISFLLDTRYGGDVVNVTGRSLYSNGQHGSLEAYRNREIIVDGVVQQADGSFTPNTKAIIFNQTNMNNYFNSVSSNFVEDGSYIRLSYLTIAYDFRRFLKNTALKGLKISFTGRNLFLLTRYSGADPQINSGSSNSGGTGNMGFDNYAVPNTTSFNLGLNLTF